LQCEITPMKELAIETARLTRRYGNLCAVDNLNLEVPRCSIYGFLGPNGAGKTTTIRMLLGLIRPDDGEISLLGETFKKHRLSLLKRVGSLVENPSLYLHLTGRENLEVTRRLRGVERKQITRVLEIVNLEKDADRKTREYSLGMRQRLGLALALLSEPDLLILDEPTNGLDPAGIHEMRELLRRLPAEHQITIFLSSHLLTEVEQIATHLGIVQSGKLLFQGPLETIQAQRQVCVALEVDQPEMASNILNKAGWTVQSCENQRLNIAASSRADAVAVNRLVVNQGIEVSYLSLERPTLEETFLNMTRKDIGKEQEVA
jgi:lantibiotic transport system ATP-binding protein